MLLVIFLSGALPQSLLADAVRSGRAGAGGACMYASVRNVCSCSMRMHSRSSPRRHRRTYVTPESSGIYIYIWRPSSTHGGGVASSSSRVSRAATAKLASRSPAVVSYVKIPRSRDQPPTLSSSLLLCKRSTSGTLALLRPSRLTAWRAPLLVDSSAREKKTRQGKCRGEEIEEKENLGLGCLRGMLLYRSYGIYVT